MTPTAPSPGLGEREAVAAEPPFHPAPSPIPVRDLYFLVECGNCGWVGSSEQLGGSGSDGDIWCPVCCDSLLDDETDQTAAAKHGEAVYQRILTAEAERDAAITRAEEAERLRNAAEAEGLEHYRRSQVGVSGMMTIVESFKQIEAARDTALAKLAQAEGEIATMRERAAKVADAAEDNNSKADSPYDGGSGSLGYEMACRDIAEAIRTLPLTTPEPPHGD